MADSEAPAWVCRECNTAVSWEDMGSRYVARRSNPICRWCSVRVDPKPRGEYWIDLDIPMHAPIHAHGPWRKPEDTPKTSKRKKTKLQEEPGLFDHRPDDEDQ